MKLKFYNKLELDKLSNFAQQRKLLFGIFFRDLHISNIETSTICYKFGCADILHDR